MKIQLITLILGIFLSAMSSQAASKMQHGFILPKSLSGVASHLVAHGHHSWQATVEGILQFESDEDRMIYNEQIRLENGRSYFVLNAQEVDLNNLEYGQILEGPIVASRIGEWTPGNVVIESATFTIQDILINIPNPFFSPPSLEESPEKPETMLLCCPDPEGISECGRCER